MKHEEKSSARTTTMVSFEERARRWYAGLANQERLKQIFPFLDEDEGYF